MDFTTFLITRLNALQQGLLLCLVASGLTLIFGILSLINLGRGGFYMIGTYKAHGLAPVLAHILGDGCFAMPWVGLVLAAYLWVAVLFGIGAYAAVLLSPQGDANHAALPLGASLAAAALCPLHRGRSRCAPRVVYFTRVTLAFAQMAGHVLHDTPVGGGAGGIHRSVKPVLAIGGATLLDPDKAGAHHTFALEMLVLLAGFRAMLLADVYRLSQIVSDRRVQAEHALARADAGRRCLRPSRRLQARSAGPAARCPLSETVRRNVGDRSTRPLCAAYLSRHEWQGRLPSAGCCRAGGDEALRSLGATRRGPSSWQASPH